MGVGLVIIGAVLGDLVSDQFLASLRSFLSRFATSAGFGGLAAVAAAYIAYLAATTNANLARQQAENDRQHRVAAERKAQWWARARWALDLTVSGDSPTAEVGHRVLESLADSEWAGEHEADIIAAATSDALEATEEPSGPPIWTQRLRGLRLRASRGGDGR